MLSSANQDMEISDDEEFESSSRLTNPDFDFHHIPLPPAFDPFFANLANMDVPPSINFFPITATQGPERTFSKLASSEEISKNLGLLPGPPASLYLSATKHTIQYPAKEVKKVSKTPAAVVRADANVPPLEYEQLRKEFAKKVHEVFNSGKPHSKSKVLMVAAAATRKCYMYKAAERCISHQLEKMIEQDNYSGIRACVYLVDAIISNARREFGRKKEKFSARLLPMLSQHVGVMMKMQVVPIFASSSVDAAAAHVNKKRISELHRAKRETLRLIRCWLDKQYFRDAAVLDKVYEEWSVHFPELSALQTVVTKRTRSPSLRPKKIAKTSHHLKIGNDREKSTMKIPTAKLQVKPVSASAILPRDLPLPVAPVQRTLLPLPIAAPPLSSSLLSTSYHQAAQGSTRSDGLDLESRVRALAGAGRLVNVPLLSFPGLLPTPGTGLLATPYLPPQQQVPAKKSLVKLPLQPPQLPVYSAYQEAGKKHLLKSPEGLIPLPVSQVGKPGSALTARTEDQLAAFYRDVAVVRNSVAQSKPPTPTRRVDPFSVLERWFGFVPRNRPNHMTVVTSLLSLHYLPKDEAKKASIEDTIRRLFSNFGGVLSVTVTGNSAVINMESRFYANRAKRSILEPQSAVKVPQNFVEDEMAMLQLIRNKKVLLEWHPNELVKKEYLKYWESMPHGVAFIPFDVCNSTLTDRHGTFSHFDLEKCRAFIKDVLAEQTALIVPDSITNSRIEAVYQQIIETVPPIYRK